MAQGRPAVNQRIHRFGFEFAEEGDDAFAAVALVGGAGHAVGDDVGIGAIDVQADASEWPGGDAVGELDPGAAGIG